MNYIYAGDGLTAIYVKNGTSDTMYYVHKDYLGSMDALTNDKNTVVQYMSFDACSVKHGFCEARAKTDVERIPMRSRHREGRRRNPTNWTFTSVPSNYVTDRGYTGHEHMDKFGLINMNGRVYNPVLGRFHNPDPVITGAGGTQSWNRYSYVLNNPLKYTDPSGYIPEWYLPRMRWSTPQQDGGRRRPGGRSGDGGLGVGGNGSPGFSTLENNTSGTNDYDWTYALWKARNQGFKNSIESFFRQWDQQTSTSNFNGNLKLVYIKKQINSEENSEVKAIRGYVSIDLNAQGGGDRSNLFDFVDKTAFIGETATGGRLIVEMEYIQQARFNNRLAGIPGKAVPNALRAISRTGKVLGTIGVGAVYGNATYEVIQGEHNTHTWVDVTISTGLFVAAIAGGPITVGVVAVVGLTYGTSQLFAGDEMEGWIDNNFGYR